MNSIPFFRVLRKSHWLIFTAALALFPAAAQDVKPGTVEVSGSGGGTYLRAGGDGTTKAFGGGGVAVALHRRAWLTGDFSYIPLGSFSTIFTDFIGAVTTASASGRLVAFEGGTQFNLASLQSRAVPYAAAHVGFGHGSGEGEVTVRYGSLIERTRFDESSTAFSAGGGFGVRIYAGQRWGIRPEFRIMRYFTDGEDLTSFRFGIGLFVQFGR